MIELITDKLIKRDGLCLDISYISECGGRVVNEDSVAVSYNGEKLFLAIADGLGGHGGGDIASKIAAETIDEENRKITHTNTRRIKEVFREINDKLLIQQTNDLQMKTTLAWVICERKRIITANIGDTRIYIFSGDKILKITADHSIAYAESDKDDDLFDKIRKHPKRHILYAALGVPNVQMPDICRQKIKCERSILICSDGFWEYVNEREMCEKLKTTDTSHDWLEAMLKLHSEKIDIYNDNYSAICLKIIKN